MEKFFMYEERVSAVPNRESMESGVPRVMDREVRTQYGKIYSETIIQAYLKKQMTLHKARNMFGLKKAEYILKMSNRFFLEELGKKMILIKPIWDELKEETDLIAWLKQIELRPQNLFQNHNEESLRLKGKYKTDPNSRGASQTDIDLISFAKIEGHAVVTQEREQLNKPAKISHCKIPLICQKENVPCMSFLKFLQENNIVV